MVDNAATQDRPETAEEKAVRAARKRAEDMRGLVVHTGSFLAVGFGFFFLNLVTSRDSWWFFYPMIPWFIGYAIHAWNVMSDRVFDDNWAERHAKSWLDKQHGTVHPKRPVSPAPRDTATATASATGVSDTIDRASELIDGMRTWSRGIPKPDVRDQALAICAAADRVLSAVIDNPDETALARDFVDRYLTPAAAILRDYARLAIGDVPSAQATLEKVERNDFPQLQEKFNELYDRLHRGRLIDLEVAREMLSLDVADWDDRDILPAPERERAPRTN